MHRSGNHLEIQQPPKTDTSRRKTYPHPNPSKSTPQTEKKRILPRKPKISIEKSLAQQNPISGNNQSNSTKSENREEITFGVIDEHEELAYEAGFKKSTKGSNNSNNNVKENIVYKNCGHLNQCDMAALIPLELYLLAKWLPRTDSCDIY